jgi:hypothetical protein
MERGSKRRVIDSWISPLSIAALASPYLNLKAMERGRG